MPKYGCYTINYKNSNLVELIHPLLLLSSGILSPLLPYNNVVNDTFLVFIMYRLEVAVSLQNQTSQISYRASWLYTN